MFNSFQKLAASLTIKWSCEELANETRNPVLQAEIALPMLEIYEACVRRNIFSL
jgi:hypothetical protein